MKVVYICSPLKGDGTPEAQQRNMENARNYCQLAIEKYGVIPIAPHIYLTQFLDDNIPEQRALGLRMAKELLTICSEAWVYPVYGISEGMHGEIELAEQIGIPIVFRDWIGEQVCSAGGWF